MDKEDASKLDYWAATDVGKQRNHNEDNFLVDSELKLFIVADGMGGHAAGEVASSLCVQHIRERLLQKRAVIDQYVHDPSRDRAQLLQVLEATVQSACSTIFDHAQSDTQKRGMGTTCSLLLLVGANGFLAHVGDSRIYLIRQGQVHQLSEDHSLVNALIRRGSLNKNDNIDQSPYAQFKNAVTRAVGVYPSVEVDTFGFDVLPNDEFLICSDGLHAYLDEKKVISTLEQKSAQEATQAFIDHANAQGGQDNITSIVVRVGQIDADERRTKEVRLRLEVLKGMPIFRYLNYKELVKVMNITSVRHASDGETLFREGEEADEFFIILNGKVRLYKADALLTELGRGAHFGEMSLIDNTHRSASAKASGNARLLVLRRNDFYGIIRNENRVSVKLLWSLVQVLAQRLRKTTADLSEARAEASLPDFTEQVFFDEQDLI